MPTYRDLLQQVKAEIEEVDAAEARDLLESADPPLFLDVREEDEWNEGQIPGAIHIPRGNLESRVENAAPDHAQPIVDRIEVDTELGTIRVLKVTAAHDVGRAINPTLIEGQIEGGVAQGLGMALTLHSIFNGGNNGGSGGSSPPSAGGCCMPPPSYFYQL